MSAEEKSQAEQEIADETDLEIVDQDPGEQQKRNQGDQQDDPLAA